MILIKHAFTVKIYRDRIYLIIIILAKITIEIELNLKINYVEETACKRNGGIEDEQENCKKQ